MQASIIGRDAGRAGGAARALLAALLAVPLVGAAVPVEATLQPAQITLGESAELTLTSSGSTQEPITLPAVKGLEFRIIGQSHRVEIVRGATLVTTALIVRVTPSAAGTYTIPPVAPKAPPLVLRVDPDNGTGAARFGKLSGAAKGAARADAIRLTADGSAYMRMILPKKEIYVGESVPVDIELGMRDGFVKSLNGLPTLNNAGANFTLNNLSHQPERVQKLIDGKGFTLLTWHSVLAAVKPGAFPLSVETPLTVRIPLRPQRESLLEDSLGDPFLQNVFGATVPKDITVASPPADLTVLSLPLEGRPAAFSGAVGSFKIASEVSPATAAAGDPVTLRLHVTGSGNFDRVDTSLLDHLDAWKTYPPKSHFKAGGAALQGEKVFEQPLIAAKPGAQTLPALTFSYFDPATRRYETARSAPVSVAITDSAADRSLRAPDVAGAAGGGLRPDHAADLARHDSLLPLYLQPRFLALPSTLTLALAGWLLLRRRAAQGGERPPGREPRPSKATRRVLEELEAAGRSGNAVAFFNTARAALLGTAGAAACAASEDIRQLFALADEANYSGNAPRATDFVHWTHIVRRHLLQGQAA